MLGQPDRVPADSAKRARRESAGGWSLVLYNFFRRFYTAMPSCMPSEMTPGRVFRTRELTAWSTNPTRLVKRWVGEGACLRLGNGLYAVPKPTEFGPAPPASGDLLRAFLGGDPFVVTGPPIWNALRLGGTQLFALPLIYNRKRSGIFRFGGSAFRLRRVRFPYPPCPEWFAVDLLENLGPMCLDAMEAERNLAARLREGALDSERLRTMSMDYGTKATQGIVRRAITGAGA